MFPNFPTAHVPYQQMVINSFDTFVKLVGYLSESFANSLEGMVLDKGVNQMTESTPSPSQIQVGGQRFLTILQKVPFFDFSIYL